MLGGWVLVWSSTAVMLAGVRSASVLGRGIRLYTRKIAVVSKYTHVLTEWQVDGAQSVFRLNGTVAHISEASSS